MARKWLETSDFGLIRVTDGDERRAREIVIRYEDKSYSLVDATSFAAMERTGLTAAFTFDRHFRRFGLPILDDLVTDGR